MKIALRFFLLIGMTFLSAPHAAGQTKKPDQTKKAVKKNTQKKRLSGPARWEQTIAAFETQDKETPQPENGILFVGSSSIRLWSLPHFFPQRDAINRGFGGSQISDAIHFADRIVLKHRPRVIVFYSGDNDIAAGKSPQRVFNDYQTFVKKVRHELPRTKIIFIAIKPSIKRWDKVGLMREANRLIREGMKGDPLQAFADIDKPSLGRDGKPRAGLFIKDGLHLNATGYELWTRILTPYLEDENWPQFRGPAHTSISTHRGLPAKWDEKSGDGVTWKTKIHGRGWSSPVVWDDQIWITTATPDGKQMSAICVDRNNGKVIHDILLFENEKPRFCHAMNSYASPTPAIEEGRVYVHFGSYGTAALDSKTGQVIWKRQDLPCDHFRGPASSPYLFRDRLFIHYDGFDQQYIVALNKKTGKTIWKVNRDVEYGTTNGDIMKAYSTPIVVAVAGKQQLISPTSKACIAYDPFTGKEIWRVRFPGFSATAQPSLGNGMLYINTGFSKAELLAVKLGGKGDVTDTHVSWTAKRGIPSKPTQLLLGNLLFMIDDNGVGSCIDAKTGDTVWTKRIGGKYSSSPLFVDGKIYLFSHEGKVTIIKPAREFKLISQFEMPGGFMATPAVSGKSLIVRSKTHLYRIEK